MVQVISFLLGIIESICAAVLEGVFSFIGSLGTKEKGAEYSASFVSTGRVLSLFNLGFSLRGGLRATTRDIATRNALIVGPSGSGKTSTVLAGTIATLARGGSSMIIMDVSSELYKLFSGFLKMLGYTIYCINFGNSWDSFNFLWLLNDLTEIQKMAFLLIKNSHIESKSDPYWSVSAEMMLSIFIEYMVFHVQKEYCTPGNLVRLLDCFAGNPKKIDLLFVKTRNQDLISRYKAMNSVSEKTLQSTLATVRSAIKLFGAPALKYCTATNTIDFTSFRRKAALFICTPLNDVDFYAPLSAVLFEICFKEMMSKVPDTRNEKYVYFLIDEMASMRFQNLGLIFANCRKYAMGCMGVIQDERMLEMGMTPAEAHAIKTNCYSKVYLPGQPLATCKQLEEQLGKYTYQDERTNAEKTRLLMSAAEIRMCKEAIILVGNEPPMKAHLIPYYEHWRLRKWTALPPYELPARNVTEPPEMQFE